MIKESAEQETKARNVFERGCLQASLSESYGRPSKTILLSRGLEKLSSRFDMIFCIRSAFNSATAISQRNLFFDSTPSFLER